MDGYDDNVDSNDDYNDKDDDDNDDGLSMIIIQRYVLHCSSLQCSSYPIAIRAPGLM